MSVQRPEPTAPVAAPYTPTSSGSWKPAAGGSSVPSVVSRSDASMSVESEPESQPTPEPLSATVRLKGPPAEQADPVKPVPVEATAEPVPYRKSPKRRRWAIPGAVIAACLIVGLTAVGLWLPNDDENRSSGSGSGPATEQKPPLRFALGQHLSRKKRLELYKHVADFLEERLERPVELLTPDQVTQLGRKLEAGELDLLAISPLLYVKLKQQHPDIPILATARFRRNRTYQGLILARADGNIRTLEDLKGKRFCWVSKHSTSGYLFPRLAMRQVGLNPDEMFSWTTQAKRHIRALDLLQKGTCDAAAVVNMLYYRLKVTGQISTPLRIIAPTAPIPEDAVCASPKLSPKARKRIEEALLEFDAKKHVTEAPVSKEASRVTSFAPGEDSTYDVVR
jgi:phosphonate transport system substrate-binding protein